jgi:hypothetical protein
MSVISFSIFEKPLVFTDVWSYQIDQGTGDRRNQHWKTSGKSSRETGVSSQKPAERDPPSQKKSILFREANSRGVSHRLIWNSE